MSDWEVNAHADDVSELILKIGKNALPVLEDFASNGSCNIFVNEWAQEMIFMVLGLTHLRQIKNKTASVNCLIFQVCTTTI